jgi:hypothetical protein
MPEELFDQARAAILNRVIELAPKATSTTLLSLAEAFAWVSVPGQTHGAGASS